MKQILQDLKTGETVLAEVPCPRVKSGQLLIQTTASLISAGTERMLMEFGKAGWVEKARQQPDKVKQVIDKIKTDGLMPTMEAVKAKLDQPLALGYCNVGIVQDAGGRPEVTGFRAGDRVVSNGPHAEVVCVPKNLCARIPANVSDDEAAFTVLGAIGLQGVRLARPSLGECFAVIGLGLIGLLTVQILRANGCRVLGIDLDSSKCALARQFGAETVDLSQGENPLLTASSFSRGRGVDGVLITAATKSNEPVHQAAEMCRQGGRIVLVGVTGLELRRDDFYKKELSFQVSCSYGPGRYDPEYEDKGHDYPLGFVRWTEQRNFEAVLDLLAQGKLSVKLLISHRFEIEKAVAAYELISSGKEPYIGIILTYGEPASPPAPSADLGVASLEGALAERPAIIKLREAAVSSGPAAPTIGFIGAGGFSGKVILPILQKTGARLKVIASRGGVSGTHLGKKFGFEASVTDTQEIFADPEIDTVFITTRHNSHGPLVLEALRAGKHVYVEKPLCLTYGELEQIKSAWGESRSSEAPEGPILMVGFNRRFAPQIQKMKSLLKGLKEPKAMVMTVNAGMIPGDHWTQDPEVGGGRIIGEACHFIDLLRYLVGQPIIQGAPFFTKQDGPQDVASFSLKFADGSIGTVHYFANGSKAFPKERLEIFCGGRILQLENFINLRGYGWPGFKKMNLWRQDKGHAAEIKAFIEAVRNGGPSPIPFEEIEEITRTTLDIAHD
jgi:predicted dehydrogenase/threonine dehydrogenase-like Zn-dependent dehydrogenase